MKKWFLLLALSALLAVSAVSMASGSSVTPNDNQKNGIGSYSDDDNDGSCCGQDGDGDGKPSKAFDGVKPSKETVYRRSLSYS